VFVPPWSQAKLPPGWAGVLDRYGLIFVTAARSGNEESVLGRREPLALIAAANIEARYRVDPDRVYVGGLSGGSRIALRLALGYPDLFRGALLNAGSDPIGGTDMPLPPRDLFYLFQTRTRLVYFTGGQDTDHLAMDAGSLASLREWCVFGAQDQVIPGGHHEIASADALDRALKALEAPAKPDKDRLAACRAATDRELNAKLNQAQALLAAGHRDAAMRALTKIDRHYGGVAAPRSLDLASP
jgi:pimeloyl-ACP methyl ester carboxylesterase